MSRPIKEKEIMITPMSSGPLYRKIMIRTDRGTLGREAWFCLENKTVIEKIKEIRKSETGEKVDASHVIIKDLASVPHYHDLDRIVFIDGKQEFKHFEDLIKKEE